MSLEDIIKLVQGVGFPAAVAAFVLLRVESRLKELADAVTKLDSSIAVLEVKSGAKP